MFYLNLKGGGVGRYLNKSNGPKAKLYLGFVDFSIRNVTKKEQD